MPRTARIRVFTDPSNHGRAARGQDLSVIAMGPDGDALLLPALAIRLTCEGRTDLVHAEVLLRIHELDVVADTESIPVDAVGQRFYEAYCASSEWKNFRGEACPPWPALTEAVRNHWMAVARDARRAVNHLALMED